MYVCHIFFIFVGCMPRKCYIIILICLLSGTVIAQNYVYPEGSSVVTRIKLPTGYKRMKVRDHTTFFVFIQDLPLLPSGTPVMYAGNPSQPVAGKQPIGVVDMMLDDENLQQEPQSLMRLWAEYLFEQERYEDIRFHIRNGKPIAYDKWKEGVKGVVDRTAYWTKTPKDLKVYSTFRRYLNFVFKYSDFTTLQVDLRPLAASELMPGTVLLTGKDGSYAAVMVLDVATSERGEQLVVLARGGSPAQSIQVLQNNVKGSSPQSLQNLGPWFRVESDGKINIGDVTFTLDTDLYRF